MIIRMEKERFQACVRVHLTDYGDEALAKFVATSSNGVDGFIVLTFKETDKNKADIPVKIFFPDNREVIEKFVSEFEAALALLKLSWAEIDKKKAVQKEASQG